jgi:(S)-3,5-dihydroxyphenylglycine transaminase
VVAGLLLQHEGSLDAIARPKAQIYRRNLDTLLRALDRHLGPEATIASPADLRTSPKDATSNVRWNRPHGGFFVRMRIPVPANAQLLHLSASRYGVLWTPMSTFYLNGEGRHELRLSCSYLDENQIEEGVIRLAAFLQDPAVTTVGSTSVGGHPGAMANVSAHSPLAPVMP